MNLTPDGFLLFFFGFCIVFFIFKLGQARLGKKISGLNRPFPKLSSRFFENSTAFFLKTAPPSFGKKLSTGFFPPTGPAKLPSGLTNGEGQFQQAFGDARPSRRGEPAHGTLPLGPGEDPDLAEREWLSSSVAFSPKQIVLQVAPHARTQPLPFREVWGLPCARRQGAVRWLATSKTVWHQRG